MARYVGSALLVKFNSTDISSDFRSFEESETFDTVEQTAGNDTAKTYLTVRGDGTASYEAVDNDAGTIYSALDPGTEGTLIYAPQGSASTNEKVLVNAIVTDRTRTVPYADIAVISAEFQYSGTVNNTTYA